MLVPSYLLEVPNCGLDSSRQIEKLDETENVS